MRTARGSFLYLAGWRVLDPGRRAFFLILLVPFSRQRDYYHSFATEAQVRKKWRHQGRITLVDAAGTFPRRGRAGRFGSTHGSTLT